MCKPFPHENIQLIWSGNKNTFLARRFLWKDSEKDAAEFKGHAKCSSTRLSVYRNPDIIFEFENSIFIVYTIVDISWFMSS